MKNILKIFALLAAICTARSQGTTEAMSGYTLPSAAGFLSGTGGWAFKPTTNMSVTSLGCLQYMVSGPTGQGDMRVGLWAAGGVNMLAAVTIAATNPPVNVSYYAAITPVFLAAGNTYYLGVYSVSGSVLINLVTQNVDGSATLSPDIQLVGSATGIPGFTYPGTLGANNTLFLGPNFEYIPVVPEPSALALLALGGVGWGFWRKARRS
jgi:PEP-CTERM motif